MSNIELVGKHPPPPLKRDEDAMVSKSRKEEFSEVLGQSWRLRRVVRIQLYDYLYLLCLNSGCFQKSNLVLLNTLAK